MAAQADAGLVYACFTHVPLPVEFPPFVTPIHLGEAQQPGRLNLRDLAPDWVAHHPVLGSTAGAFALRRLLLARHPQATRVGICQYRKFVSCDRVSDRRDPKYRVMDVVPARLLAPPAFADWLWPGEREFLVSPPLRFTRVPWYRKGYLKEYARDHCVEDLLRFTAQAVELGVLARAEVQAFFREDRMVPGGIELGVYPAGFWIDHFGQIEQVVRACVDRYPLLREGYQARSWAFCSERLGSWLLLRRLRADSADSWLARHSVGFNQRAWAQRCAGHLNLITADDAHRGYAGGV